MSEEQTQFVGRKDALDAFHSLRTLREQKNVLYVEALGGIGKTRVLREYIAHCGQQRRPWITRPPGSTLDPLIDFYDFENRTVSGLRHSIILRLGESHFHDFLAKEAEFRRETISDSSDLTARAAALQQETDRLFFHDFKRALRQIGNYAAFFFDTFEIVYPLRVGRWFLEEFVPSAATTGCLIVFAGRPPRPHPQHPTESRKNLPLTRLPLNVRRFALGPFDRPDATAYFRNQHVSELAGQEEAILQISAGNPLLIDLLVQHRVQFQGRIEDLLGKTQSEIERAMVFRFLAPGHENVEVIQQLAYLKRRYNRDILEHSGFLFPNGLDFERLIAQLEQFPFMKVRRPALSGEATVALHDVFQEMLAEHAGGDWRDDIAGPCFENIVKNWYPDIAIANAKDHSIANVLRAEHLGYVLDHDPGGAGLTLYLKYFEQARNETKDDLVRNAPDFDLAELIWGEIFRHLQSVPDGGYHLSKAYADWLYGRGQHSAAVNLYRFIAERFVETPRWCLYALSQLGFALRQLGRIADPGLSPLDVETGPDWDGLRTAQQAFALGKLLAEKTGKAAYVTAFTHQLGRVAQDFGQWDEAKKLYEAAIGPAETGISALETDASDLPIDPMEQPSLVAWAQANLSLAVLEARLGQYPVAEARCRAAQDTLMDLPNAAVADRANAAYALAQIQRYGGHPETAHANYERALDLIDDNSVVYRAIYLQGRGANAHELGLEQRQRVNRADLLTGDHERAHRALLADIRYQAKAYEDIYASLSLCRQHDLLVRKPDAFRRIASIFKELAELERLLTTGLVDIKVSTAVTRLRKKMSKLSLTEESHWRDINRLSDGPAFAALPSSLEKAQRLLELSYLEADAIELYHECLDGISEAAGVAMRLRRSEDIKRYQRLAGALRGYAHQEALFDAQLSIIAAHLDFDEGRFEAAWAKYKQHFPKLAQIGGYAVKRLDAQFDELENRMVGDIRLSRELKLQALRSLRQAWLDAGLHNTYQPLLIQIQALIKRMMSQGLADPTI